MKMEIFLKTKQFIRALKYFSYFSITTIFTWLATDAAAAAAAAVSFIACGRPGSRLFLCLCHRFLMYFVVVVVVVATDYFRII